jgi:RecA-family ATPase
MPYVPQQWLWEGLLSYGTCSILSGKPKDGKSTFVRHLIKALIEGSTFLGRKVSKAGVIYLAIEENRQYVKNVFSEIGLCSTEMLSLHVGSFDVSKPEQMVLDIKNHCETLESGLIVIDPFIKSVPSFDTNDYAKSTQATQLFLDLARSTDAHVLLIHHARKGESSGQESAMGSNGLSGGVDNTIVLEKSSKFSTLSFRGRYIESQELSFRLEGSNLVNVDTNDKFTYLRDSICRALTQKSSQTRDQLRASVACRDQDLASVLNELVASQKILVEGAGVRGSKKTYKINSLPSDIGGKE